MADRYAFFTCKLLWRHQNVVEHGAFLGEFSFASDQADREEGLSFYLLDVELAIGEVKIENVGDLSLIVPDLRVIPALTPGLTGHCHLKFIQTNVRQADGAYLLVEVQNVRFLERVLPSAFKQI